MGNAVSARMRFSVTRAPISSANSTASPSAPHRETRNPRNSTGLLAPASSAAALSIASGSGRRPEGIHEGRPTSMSASRLNTSWGRDRKVGPWGVCPDILKARCIIRGMSCGCCTSALHLVKGLVMLTRSPVRPGSRWMSRVSCWPAVKTMLKSATLAL